MERNCEVCRWCADGVCRLPLYVDGIFYGGRELPKKGSCELFEPEEGSGELFEEEAVSVKCEE